MHIINGIEFSDEELAELERTHAARLAAREINRRECLSGVYFIRCLDYVKIGHGSPVGNRLKLFQTGNPFKLDLMGVIEAPSWALHLLERLLHVRFKAFLLKRYPNREDGWPSNEWFELSDEILDFIAEVNQGGVRFENFAKENGWKQNEPIDCTDIEIASLTAEN